jgi:hypothetical protein
VQQIKPALRFDQNGPKGRFATVAEFPRQEAGVRYSTYIADVRHRQL